jgi:hypothetical protein
MAAFAAAADTAGTLLLSGSGFADMSTHSVDSTGLAPMPSCPLLLSPKLNMTGTLGQDDSDTLP